MYLFLFFFFHFHFCVWQTEFARRPQFLVPPIALHFIGEKVRSQFCASSLPHSYTSSSSHNCRRLLAGVFSLSIGFCVCFFAVALLLAVQRSSRQKRHGTVHRFHLGGLDFARQTINNKYCFFFFSFRFLCVRSNAMRLELGSWIRVAEKQQRKEKNIETAQLVATDICLKESESSKLKLITIFFSSLLMCDFFFASFNCFSLTDRNCGGNPCGNAVPATIHAHSAIDMNHCIFLLSRSKFFLLLN